MCKRVPRQVFGVDFGGINKRTSLYMGVYGASMLLDAKMAYDLFAGCLQGLLSVWAAVNVQASYSKKVI